MFVDSTLIERNAYRAEQKNYAIVTVSDKGSYSHELAEEEEVFVHSFEKALFSNFVAFRGRKT
jgi:hypothetical protein